MSAQIKDGGSAFPLLPPVDGSGGSAVGYPYPESGMTLRDYFAAKAMQSLICSPLRLYDMSNKRIETRTPSILAILSYEHADAMLVAREAQP